MKRNKHSSRKAYPPASNGKHFLFCFRRFGAASAATNPQIPRRKTAVPHLWYCKVSKQVVPLQKKYNDM
ncbi:MAG: hypothetical protein LBT42_06885, partial [Tannerella sp.]|nr:hypothetical protein [Tannerella sp.]